MTRKTRSVPVKIRSQSPHPRISSYDLEVIGMIGCVKVTAGIVIGLVTIVSPVHAQKATVRDSAGITIVENSRAMPARSAVTLSRQPIAEVVGRTDRPEYFFSPNVVAAGRLSDGRIVIADQGSFNIRVFDAQGRYQRTMGSMGAGPGQLGLITRMYILPGDTIAVVDGRVSLFMPDGRFLRVESMGRPGLTPLARLADGAWISRRGTGADSVRVFRVARSATGASPTDTGQRLAVYDPHDPSLKTGSYIPDGLGTTPFLPAVIIAGTPDGFLMGDGQTWEIRDYSSTGRLRRIIRRDADLRLTDAIRATYANGERAGKSGEALEAVERRLAAAVFPKTIPAFQRILIDPRGRIWVQEHLRANQVPLHWTVLSREGKVLGTVEVPVGFRVFEVGDGYMLGRIRDGGGVRVQILGVSVK